MKVYNLMSYKNNKKETRESLAVSGNIETISNLLENNQLGYHEITQGEDVLILHGDLDFHEKKEDTIVNIYGNIMIRELNKIFNMTLDLNDFKYTKNDGKRDKHSGEPVSSFHWSIPKICMIKYEQKYLLRKIHNENYEEINESGIIVNNSGGKWKDKKRDVDEDIYKSDSAFRLPNQLKAGKENTSHTIVNGNMKDFITQYIEKSELKSFNEKVEVFNISEKERKEKKEKKEAKKQDETVQEEAPQIKTEVIIYNDKKKIIEEFINKCYTFDRSSVYGSWLDFGICCKNSFDKEDAIYLWKEFSKKDLEKFEKTDFEKCYENLKINEGYKKKLTIWSLYYWAKFDNSEEYKKILKTDFKFVNLDKLINHTEIPKLVKEFSPDTFIWKKTVDGSKDYWKMYYFNGVKWNLGEEGFRAYVGNDLVDKLDDLYVKNIEDEKEKKEMYKKLKLLKDSGFKSGCITESKTIFKNDKLEFDMNDYLLGFNNCVLDLQTCKARPYKYDDFITFSTGWDLQYNKTTGDIFYDNEKRKELEKLLKSIHRKDEERQFWLEVLSSGLDGKAYQKIFIFTGFGGNGKGTINDFICFLLGDDYSKGNVKSGLISDELTDGPNPALAKISKKRFITFQEPVKAKKLNNSTLKELTGGGKTISARACHSNDINTYLNMTLIIECNERPLLKEKAGGSMKRRLEILEFEANFTEDEEDINGITHFKADGKYSSKEWRDEHKHEFLQILLENYKNLKERNYEFLKLDSSRKQCETYIQNSDLVLNWFNNNYKKVSEKDEKGKIVLLTLDEIYEDFKFSDIYDSLSKKEKLEFTKKEFYNNFKTKPYYREEQRIKRKVDDKIKVFEYTNVLLGIKKEEKKINCKILENVEDDENILCEDD